MYDELEFQYNNHGLTDLENKLQEDKRSLQKVFDETRGELKIRTLDQKVIKDKEVRSI